METNERIKTCTFSKGEISENRNLASGIYKITIDTAECYFSCPGQIVIIEFNGERKAFPVSEYDGKRFSIAINTEEEGFAKELSKAEMGTEVAVCTGLGNGFDVDAIPEGATIVADTKGISQMLSLTRELLMRGKNCKLVLGYPNKESIFMVDSFKNLCNDIEVLTEDGSNGREGRVEDGIREAEYVCAGGSVEMLQKLAKKTEDGQFNMICSVNSEEDVFSICKNGPVFEKDNINWNML
ncbi:MAG TPA: hypothetical protein GX736_00455 [Mogibacterium sp.]|nr:hypothetical protein [Mogibacterium sp.]